MCVGVGMCRVCVGVCRVCVGVCGGWGMYLGVCRITDEIWLRVYVSGCIWVYVGELIRYSFRYH